MSREQGLKWLAILALIVGAVVVVPWDVRVSRWFATNPLPGELKTAITLSEAFAHGFSVIAIAISVGVARRSWRPSAWLLTTAFGSGLVANLIKLNVARLRPYASSLTDPDSIWPGFSGWIPWWKAEPGWLDHATQSFPSGHTAAAFGLAFGLTTLYPQGRYWWFALAVMAGLQRIESQAHYPSDVLAGAVVGLLVSGALMRFSRWILGGETPLKGRARAARP